MRGRAGRAAVTSTDVHKDCGYDHHATEGPARPLILPRALRAGPSFSHKGRRVVGRAAIRVS